MGIFWTVLKGLLGKPMSCFGTSFLPHSGRGSNPRRQKLPGDKKPPHPFHPPCEEPFFLDDVISGSRASEQLWVTRCWQLLAGEMP